MIQESQFAKVTSELLGTKMATDLVLDIWKHAAGPLKNELADAVIKNLKERIERIHADDNYEFRKSIDDAWYHICRDVEKEVESRIIPGLPDTIEKMIRDQVEARLEKGWKEIIQKEADGFINRFTKDCLNKVMKEKE